MGLVAPHFLPGLDWLVKISIGLIVATAGVLLFRQPRRGGLGLALALFIAETGTLVAIRGLVAASASSRWQYIMPFGLVLVPALFVTFILTRLGWWRRAGFTWPGAWRAPHLAVPLVATLALPIVGLSARGFMPTIALVLALQIVFMLVDVFMEEEPIAGSSWRRLRGTRRFRAS